MARSFDDPQHSVMAFKAAADLTTKQYLFAVVASETTVNVAAATTARMIGVIYNTPASGQTVQIVNAGIAFVYAGGSVSTGNPVSTDGTGKAVAVVPGTDTTRYVAGTALADGSSGDLIPVLLDTCPGRAS